MPGGSQAGSQATSRTASPSRAQPGYPPALGYDPARGGKRELTVAEKLGKRIDLPIDAYTMTSKSETAFARRPGFNKDPTVKNIQVQLNVFPVMRWPRKDVRQYDFAIRPMPEKGLRSIIKQLWSSSQLTAFRRAHGGQWLFDGSALAWSSDAIPRGEQRFEIDLDAENQRAPGRRPNKFQVRILETKTIRMEYLKQYVEQKIPFDTTVLECMNFLDHALRQTPSEHLLLIKRQFYSLTGQRFRLGNYLEVMKGTYSAFRLCNSISTGGTGLGLNVDVTNTVFIQTITLVELVQRMVTSFKREWSAMDINALQRALKPTLEGPGRVSPSEASTLLRRLQRVKITVQHRGNQQDPQIFTIKRLVWNERNGPNGTNARNCMFDRQTEDGRTESISVYDYFLQKYQIRLRLPDLPLIETTKGDKYPMEVCNVAPNQRYAPKLDPDQTAQMIRIAVTRPDQRKADIMNGVNQLNWQQDPVLKAFDIEVTPNMAVTQARLIQNPKITFGNAAIDPGMSGRWDLRGKKLLEPNKMPLSSWGMFAIGTACQRHELEAFAKQFVQVYRGHGGNIASAPFLDVIPFSHGNYSQICERAYISTGNANKATPQMIFFVLADKNQLTYNRIKKSMDCRYCVVSQCLQGLHVKKNQAQYASNVVMKVNSKLGGATCKIAGPQPTTPPFFQMPTMIIGADVSHASPGSSTASMAAMTMSMDKHATRYAAACETNGHRVEIIQPALIHGNLARLLRHWVKINGCVPKHLYYFRDGVSDGQFQQVIDREVKEIKRMFKNEKMPEPMVTVVIATKRHHIRFFPKPGDKSSADRNNNPLPGTVVEHTATHPHHYDFYLCSHVAIQGTARPVHYIVIYDEAKVEPAKLQKMIYQQCYQYCRSTTPVSIHPAVYYSHLAAERATSHENLASSQREMVAGKQGFPIGKTDSEIYGSDPVEALPLLPMQSADARPESVAHINTTMWYV
ncbi:piwi domain-containing protein [Microdochium bolleyi]|uniref:Piwi domain-containing protein n=1 Tax=Microdochium bolleyi TaxID=196109 RepID=A0A136IX04_9PEZI|nr:piwi domain-containing protein [Microdochium bolleyi]